MTQVRGASSLAGLAALKDSSQSYILSTFVRDEIGALQDQVAMLTDPAQIPEDLLSGYTSEDDANITISGDTFGDSLSSFLQNGITGNTNGMLTNLRTALNTIITNLSTIASGAFNGLTTAQNVVDIMSANARGSRTLDGFYLPLFAKLVDLLNSGNDIALESIAQNVATEMLTVIEL